MTRVKVERGYNKVKLIDGKTTRHESIYAGLQALCDSCSPTDLVIIHDAVRPFLKEDFLANVVRMAEEHQASGSVRELVSTILQKTDDGFLKGSLIRSNHVESHTPQCFHYGVVLSAYQKCSSEDMIHGTECLHLVQKYCGVNAKLVYGPSYLWKVTHVDDMQRMKLALQTGNYD